MEVLAGESYVIETVDPGFEGGQCAANYRVLFQIGQCRRGQFRGWSQTFRTSEVSGPILEVFARTSDGERIDFPTDPCDRTFKQIKILTAQGEKKGTGFLSGAYTGIRIMGVIRTDEKPDDCGAPPLRYHFKIFNQSEEIIFERIEDVAPYAQEPQCVLQDPFFKQYDIKFIPSLLSIDADSGRPSDSRDIPPQCLEISVERILLDPQVKTRLGDLLTQENLATVPWTYYDRVCSSEGCPPPLYEVFCDPDKKCPPETCFECEHDGTVCCYGEPERDGYHKVIYSYRK